MPRIPSRAAAVWPRDGAARRREPRGRAAAPGPTAADAPGPPRASPCPPRAASRTPAAALPVRSLPSSRPAAPRSRARTPTPPWPPRPRLPLGVSSVSSETSLPLLRKKKKISKSLPPTPATLSRAGPPETSSSRLRFQKPRALPAASGTPRPRPPQLRHTSRAPGPPAWPHSRRRLTSAAAGRAPAAGGSGTPLPAAGACSGSPRLTMRGGASCGVSALGRGGR